MPNAALRRRLSIKSSFDLNFDFGFPRFHCTNIQLSPFNFRHNFELVNCGLTVYLERCMVDVHVDLDHLQDCNLPDHTAAWPMLALSPVLRWRTVSLHNSQCLKYIHKVVQRPFQHFFTIHFQVQHLLSDSQIVGTPTFGIFCSFFVRFNSNLPQYLWQKGHILWSNLSLIHQKTKKFPIALHCKF